ncbi:hypothetical protein M413DRAFT_59878, partial [Hebeloma cylindrosporum]
IPSIQIVLDVYHFMMRYLGTIINGTKNPHRSEVARDIRDAILQSGSNKGSLAKYWSKEEQEKRLCATYEKWSQRGSVWSAAASKVHADQLTHVRKGCLARHRQDIASDGSRIEGSHKGWNSLQRAHPSGIEVYSALAHDFVLRRNIRILLSHKKTNTQPSSTDLLIFWSSGSHHINLLRHLADSFNSLLDNQPQNVRATLSHLPVFQDIKTREIFGLVRSEHSESFGGLIIKEEVNDEDDQVLQELSQRMLENDGRETDVMASFTAVPESLSIIERPSTMQNTSVAATSALKRKVSPIFKKPSLPICHTSTSSASNNAFNTPLPTSSSSLTRSQLIFSVATSIDTRSLAIERGDEFYLFMDMRDTHQWSSFTMTSHKWVAATKLYNAALLESRKSKGLVQTARKNPRALVEKLGEVESNIMKRLVTRDFKCE